MMMMMIMMMMIMMMMIFCENSIWLISHSIYISQFTLVLFLNRSSLQDQNTKVAVVLIQKNAPLPPGI